MNHYTNNPNTNTGNSINNCDCIDKIEKRIGRLKEEARKKEDEFSKNLDSLKNSIIEGSEERISRMLLRAGIFYSPLEKDFSIDVSGLEIIKSLNRGLALLIQRYEDKSYERLYNFIQNKYEKILEQQKYINTEVLLRRIVNNKSKAKGLLQSNFEREVKSANSSLERVEKLKKQLESWKGNTRLQNKIQYIKICDMHD